MTNGRCPDDNGMLLELSPGDVARFWSHVDREGGSDACWPWTGHVGPLGYASFAIGPAACRQRMNAHRFAYATAHGWPGELTVDHACHVPGECPGGPGCLHRRCMNPRHLASATRGDNVRRANRRQRPENCPAGHPYSSNLVEWKGGRKCRQCHRDRQKRRYAANPQKFKDYQKSHRAAVVSAAASFTTSAEGQCSVPLNPVVPGGA